LEITLTNEVILTTIVSIVVGIIVLLRYGFALGKRRKEKEENTGEAAVRRALTRYCEKSTDHLLNNVTVTYKDGTTQIDHILITQNGILVIEAKHYSGWLFANEKQKQWTQVLFKLKHRFQNPIIQNKKHISAIKKILDFIPKEHIQGLVVFTGDAQFKTELPEGVIKIKQLEDYVDNIRIGSITENRLQFCVGRLECMRLELTSKTDIEHQKYLERKFGILGEE